ncbi:MAG: 50S ribosomal protein L15 [Caldithrix sp.]|nr:50S ribosomal protein L15 [Caldithrix sp.]
MNLNTLKPAPGSTKKNRRRGRGEASGRGVTAGRGHKGYRSRAGSKRRAWFEGGQMPIQRRLPKFGFVNRNRVVYQVVNVSQLESLTDIEKIDKTTLKDKGLIKNNKIPVKVLGSGELTKKIQIEVDAVSKSAKDKIEKAGGSVTLA